MARSSQPLAKDKQSQRFVDAARELGADEDEARFDSALKKVASAPPPKGAPKPEPKKKPAE
ncbi:hypothetical protein BVIR_13 [Blastochloris viridis]|uniref:Uncharacterized protein n=1 Tax=Blastochloris viridis TaxID=1079 RepID=A0A0H5B9N2_BLAVI|nr:hypothetical protein BVIR_13 [Blastochloris viridis]BAR98922.1 hypothetical protein BV133_1329 [Blastochloris viridis]CUU43753.1 hypothetical protein BVIRIDIS_27790 [Blastochloris viridis]